MRSALQRRGQEVAQRPPKRRTCLHLGLAILTASLVATSSGCIEELYDLWDLQTVLAERYGEGHVNVNFENGQRELTIKLADPELRELGFAKQAEVALEVARFAKAQYARSRAVDTYHVKFGVEADTGIFHTASYTSFSFLPSELR
jgi:hypothetical protein